MTIFFLHIEKFVLVRHALAKFYSFCCVTEGGCLFFYKTLNILLSYNLEGRNYIPGLCHGTHLLITWCIDCILPSCVPPHIFLAIFHVWPTTVNPPVTLTTTLWQVLTLCYNGIFFTRNSIVLISSFPPFSTTLCLLVPQWPLSRAHHAFMWWHSLILWI